MRKAGVIGLWLLAAGVLGGTPAAAARLEVPYVPQSGVLCGGAALAMVLRYWGEPGVFAEDFAELAVPDRDGIPVAALVAAVRARGWEARVLPGTPAAARGQLGSGRPLIVLVRRHDGTFHFLVLVAWSGGRVFFHDPAAGPFRSQAEPAFTAAWSGSGNWMLLVLPGPVAPPREPPAPAETDSVPVTAELALASDRFRAGDWAGAANAAELALALDPDNAVARRLLAGSRFLDGDVDRALAAWNRLGDPRADLMKLGGAKRLRYATVAARLDLPPGRLITPAAFRRARHRLGDVPAVAAFRLDLRPRAGGVAETEVVVLERPLFDASPLGAVTTAARALVHGEAAIEVGNATGNGEMWTANWRWRTARRRLALLLAIPAGGSRAGLWQVEASRAEQAYATPTPDHATARVREERHRVGLSLGNWITADLRVDAGIALDTWDGCGTWVSFGGGARAMSAHDRVAIEATVATWRSTGDGDGFTAADLSAAWRPSDFDKASAWVVAVGLSGATGEAPRDLWNGAGTGEGRAPLLRAHPLLRDGVLDGRVFGRRLGHASLEHQWWPWRFGPLRCGWAVFIDAAGAGLTGRDQPYQWQADGGAGLRVRLPGRAGFWRIDVAHGFVDGELAVSIAQQVQ